METCVFRNWLKSIAILLIAPLLMHGALANQAKSEQTNYQLGAGDAIRIQVFQHQNLTLDTRVSENGRITYPLIGTVSIGGLTLAEAADKIAGELHYGGFVKDAQVNIVLMQVRGNQVSVLGQVNRPGRFPLETFNTRLSDILAMAGGITPAGNDVVVVTGERGGKAFRKEINVPSLFSGNEQTNNILMVGGDVIYVDRAPVYYIYGSVQRPGSYRVERNMTLQQALAQGGGATLRGSESGLLVYRKNEQGQTQTLKPNNTDQIQANDVIFVKESLF